MSLLELGGLVAALAAAFWLGRVTHRQAVFRAAGRRLQSTRDRVRKLEAQVDAASQALAGTFSAMSEAVFHLDADQRVKSCNQTAVTWFNVPPTDRPSLMVCVRSAELYDLVLQTAESGLDGVEGSAGPRVDAALNFKLRGRSLHARVRRLPNGEAILILRDDTRLERLERARRDLVANISHDLRTPLTSLRLLVDAVGEPTGANRLDQIADQMRGQVDVLQAVTDGLIELNRVESGRALFRLEPEALTTLVERAVASLAPQLEEAEIQVEVQISEAVVVLADAPQVTRVVANLLDNARRVSPPGGRIRIHAEPGPEPDRVTVRMADPGPGIPPSEIDRIFERFYRGDRSRGSVGAGLGLAIARHIVEGHGGTIHAESPPGRGAVLVFTLPIP